MPRDRPDRGAERDAAAGEAERRKRHHRHHAEPGERRDAVGTSHALRPAFRLRLGDDRAGTGRRQGHRRAEREDVSGGGERARCPAPTKGVSLSSAKPASAGATKPTSAPDPMTMAAARASSPPASRGVAIAERKAVGDADPEGADDERPEGGGDQAPGDHQPPGNAKARTERKGGPPSERVGRAAKPGRSPPPRRRRARRRAPAASQASRRIACHRRAAAGRTSAPAKGRRPPRPPRAAPTVTHRLRRGARPLPPIDGGQTQSAIPAR